LNITSQCFSLCPNKNLQRSIINRNQISTPKTSNLVHPLHPIGSVPWPSSTGRHHPTAPTCRLCGHPSSSHMPPAPCTPHRTTPTHHHHARPPNVGRRWRAAHWWPESGISPSSSSPTPPPVRSTTSPKATAHFVSVWSLRVIFAVCSLIWNTKKIDKTRVGSISASQHYLICIEMKFIKRSSRWSVLRARAQLQNEPRSARTIFGHPNCPSNHDEHYIVQIESELSSQKMHYIIASIVHANQKVVWFISSLAGHFLVESKYDSSWSLTGHRLEKSISNRSLKIMALKTHIRAAFFLLVSRL
jgi:hypothetical protein